MYCLGLYHGYGSCASFSIATLYEKILISKIFIITQQMISELIFTWIHNIKWDSKWTHKTVLELNFTPTSSPLKYKNALLYLSILLYILIHDIIPSRMQLLPSLLPLTTCFGRKRPSSGVSVMPKLFHCSLIQIACNCDISLFDI
jgi:hypothetical protein